MHDHFELTNGLEVHLIELPKLGLQGEEPRLARWARFLRASSAEDLQELAMSDTEIRRAEEALRQLSLDPAARELARERELARINWALIRGYEREEGRQVGLQEGEAQGLRVAIASVCEVLGIELTAERRQVLQAYTGARLAGLLERIRIDRCWPPIVT